MVDPENWNWGVRVTVEVPNELIQQLRQLQEMGSKEPDAKVVEGSGRVLPWEEWVLL